MIYHYVYFLSGWNGWDWDGFRRYGSRATAFLVEVGMEGLLLYLLGLSDLLFE